MTSILGISILSGLGNTPAEHASEMEAGRTGLRPLTDLLADAEYGNLQAGWIQDRSLLLSRKWAPASALALHCALEAIEDAGLSPSDLKHAAIIAGSSRGNAYLSNWPGRRPFKLMAASNSMHGEIASAVSIELGITGPWQTIASGCAASLDALGYAKMLLDSGIVKFAIVLGIELPLVPEIIQHYQHTGVLTTNGINDPYHPETSGFSPGEAGTALILTSENVSNSPKITGYWCNSDAESPIGMPSDGRGLKRCLQQAVRHLTESNSPPITAICPHASGTLLHAQAEQAALVKALNPQEEISLHPLKPFTGHSVGASGALDTAILAHYMLNKQLPPNLPKLTAAPVPFTLPEKPTSFKNATLLKIAVGMGGHNSIISMEN
ncbi:MAG: 3-oxoacyl-[acyl-carrier-protein] synthase II [Rubritalea sp.]|jgi:3-oxoacyl-[acyl-carrier-protein] synthase II